MFIGSFLPKKKNKQNQTIKINICIFFFKNFHVNLSLDQGKQFSLTQCLALTKKKKTKQGKKQQKLALLLWKA